MTPSRAQKHQIVLHAFVKAEPELARAAELARANGCRILLVGGAIRDLLLGRPVVDLDFILEGRPHRFLRRLSERLGHRIVTFRKRGIVDHRVRAGEREWDFVERGARSLRGEILRRDFTLNAIAYDTGSGVVHDPTRGLRDLAARRLRAVRPGTFRDDPLRMLRAVRLWAEIRTLALERRTARLIERDARLLPRVSAERIKSEMDRILAAPEVSRALALMERLGLLRQVLPELDPLRGLGQNRYHHLDAFRHTLAALAATDDLGALARGLPDAVFLDDPLGGAPAEMPIPSGSRRGSGGRSVSTTSRSRAPGSLTSAGPEGHDRMGGEPPAGVPGRRRALTPDRTRLLRWALLLHDTGKAFTRTLGEDGEYHFYLHERHSARIALAVMRRLRASRSEASAIERLVFLHLRLSIPAAGEMSARALRRIVRDAAELTPLLVLHSLADKLASRGPRHARTLALLRRAGRGLLLTWRTEAERARRAPRLLTGHDVMRALGMPPGREVGALLDELWELQAAGDLTTREEALAWLRRERSRSK